MKTNRSGRIQIGTLLLSGGLAAVAGFGINHQLAARDQRIVEAQTAHERRLKEAQTENVRLRTEADQLHAASPRALVAAEVPTVATVRQEALRTLAELKKQNVVSIMAGPRSAGSGVARAGPLRDQLPPELAQTFGLTEAEFGSLQAAVAKTRQRLDDLALTTARVRRESAREVVIDIALDARVEPWRAELRQDFLNVFGAERLSIYETLFTGGLDNLFRNLGGQSRVVTLTKAAETGGNHRMVEQGRDEQGRVNGTSTGSTPNFEYFVDQLGKLAGLLPADF